MADTPEQMAINGAKQEGRMAALQGMSDDVCPYPAITGGIGDQRKAWIESWKAVK